MVVCVCVCVLCMCAHHGLSRDEPTRPKCALRSNRKQQQSDASQQQHQQNMANWVCGVSFSSSNITKSSLLSVISGVTKKKDARLVFQATADIRGYNEEEGELFYPPLSLARFFSVSVEKCWYRFGRSVGRSDSFLSHKGQNIFSSLQRYACFDFPRWNNAKPTSSCATPFG